MQYSTDLYARLARRDRARTPGSAGAAGVIVARTPERMIQLRRTAAVAEAFGLDCEIITPARASEMYPVMDGPTTWWARSGCPTTARPTPPT